MKSLNKKLNIVFFIALILTIIIMSLPFHWKLNDSSGYYLDWLFVFILIPVIFITFLCLLIVNHQKFKIINSYKRINIIFYLTLILHFVLTIIPSEYQMRIYSPNYLGWFHLIIIIPVAIITFLWLLILDIKNKNLSIILSRAFLFILIIGFSIVYWFYQANKMGAL